MRREFHLAKVAGLELYIRGSAILGLFLLWGVLAGMARTLLALPWSHALLGGLIGVVFHWLSVLVHNLGHAWAARRTGYPMKGVRFWLLLGTSLYPRDQRQLPGSVHIRRALGGPLASLLLTLFAAFIVWLYYPPEELLAWVAWFVFLDNLLIFTLGASLPLGFTDGSTILIWWSRR